MVGARDEMMELLEQKIRKMIGVSNGQQMQL